MWAYFRWNHRVNIWFDEFTNSTANAALCCVFICVFINLHNTPRHLIKGAFMCKGDCNQSNRINICSSGNGVRGPKASDFAESFTVYENRNNFRKMRWFFHNKINNGSASDENGQITCFCELPKNFFFAIRFVFNREYIRPGDIFINITLCQVLMYWINKYKSQTCDIPSTHMSFTYSISMYKLWIYSVLTYFGSSTSALESDKLQHVVTYSVVDAEQFLVYT